MNTASKYYTHYANGHYWVIFDHGAIPGCSSTARLDGATWTSQGTIFAGINPVSFTNEWAVRYLGNTVIVAAFNSPNRTYRSGTLNSNGTVTWSAESAAGPADASFGSLNLLIANGRPIMWRDDATAGGAGALWRGSAIASPTWTKTAANAPAMSVAGASNGIFSAGALFQTGGAQPGRPDRAAGDHGHSLRRRQPSSGGDEVELGHRHLRRLLVQRLDAGRRPPGGPDHRGPGERRQREPEDLRRGAGLERQHPCRVREPQRRHGSLQEGRRLQQLVVASLGRDQPAGGEHRHGVAHGRGGRQPLSLLLQGRQAHLLPPLRRDGLGGGEPAPGPERHQPPGCARANGVGSATAPWAWPSSRAPRRRSTSASRSASGAARPSRRPALEPAPSPSRAPASSR